MKHDLYKSGQVARYHCNPTMSMFRQTNADHQWGVAMIILHLNPSAGIRLIRAALEHDVGEMHTGDIAWPVKQTHPEHAANHDELEQKASAHLGAPRQRLPPEDEKWLKLGDRLESLLYMQMYQGMLQWSDKNIFNIIKQAEELGVENQVKDLIDGK